MKQFCLVCLFLLSVSALSFSQNYVDAGNTCFNAGNYQCAKENFEKELKKKYNQFTDIKLSRSNNCLKSLTQANKYFLQKNYTEAKTAYQEVLDLNPNDVYAKQQIEKCNANLTQLSPTLSLSKSSLSFTALGGNENIYIATNSSSYTVELLPSWCTVKKYSDYFVITCNSNPSINTRNDYFEVKSADKLVRVYINQVGKVETTINNSPTTLSISKEYLYFSSTGGKSESIKVISNASTYSISMIPSWCSVEKYTGYFVVTCNVNSNSQKRSDWFYVTAGDKQIKVYIDQNGSLASNKSNIKSKTKSTNLYFGVGGLKPMVFRADGKTFANNEIGYNFMIGLVKTIGVYSKVSTNFSTTFGDYTPSNLPTSYYIKTINAFNSTFTRLGVVGGLMIDLRSTMIYFGAGKGYYYHLNKTNLYNYLDDSYAKTINLTTISESGFETDAGLILKFNKLGLSFGISSVNFSYMELNLGLGISF